MEMDKAFLSGSWARRLCWGSPCSSSPKAIWLPLATLSVCGGVNRDLFLPMLFLFAATIVSSLAGPGSRVLMIPINDWFLDSAWTVPGPPAPNYPYIMVRLTFEYSNNIGIYVSDPLNGQVLELAAPSFRYWTAFALLIPVIESVPQTESTYDYTTGTTSVR